MPETPDSSTSEPIARLRQRLDECLAAHDRPSAVAGALDAVRSGDIAVETLYVGVLVPLLVDTGSRWQTGAEQVWEEHYASGTVRTIVEGLYPAVTATAAKSPRLGKTAVLACPPGEHHDLGLRMLADRMQLAGWDVHFLGADTPVDDIAAAARTLGAQLVALTAATHYGIVLARSVVERLLAVLPGVRVAIGGPAVRCADDWPVEYLLTEEELGLNVTADPTCEG